MFFFRAWDQAKDSDGELVDCRERNGAPTYEIEYLRWAREHNDGISRLCEREGAARDKWRAFLVHCVEMEKECGDYRAVWRNARDKLDSLCQSWTFKPDARVLLGRDLPKLSDQDLDEMASRLAELQQRVFRVTESTP